MMHEQEYTPAYTVELKQYVHRGKNILVLPPYMK